MEANKAKNLSRDERRRMSSGRRTKFKGRRGILKRNEKGKLVFHPKSHTHGGKSQANKGWTCGDALRFPRGLPSKAVELGPYRVAMPNNLTKVRGPLNKG